jgi:hypothetical protein
VGEGVTLAGAAVAVAQQLGGGGDGLLDAYHVGVDPAQAQRRVAGVGTGDADPAEHPGGEFVVVEAGRQFADAQQVGVGRLEGGGGPVAEGFGVGAGRGFGQAQAHGARRPRLSVLSATTARRW